MRLMITGATTPLGQRLIETLLRSPDTHFILAMGRESELPVVPDARLAYHHIDLTRPRVLHDLVWGDARDHGIECVVHAMQHRDTGDVGEAIHRQNVETTRTLVQACAHHPTIRRLVYRSFAEVYALQHTTSNLLDEDSPIDFGPIAPQWVRDRVEADVIACFASSGPLAVAILRCAEILGPDSGSQLWDYLQSRVCLRPFGFDPMINVLSLDDAVTAIIAAIHSTARGVFNIPGFDTLPLSSAIASSHRANLPIPGPVIGPMYGLRRWLAGFRFRYDLDVQRFHFGGVLDGRRARDELGYTPATPVRWPERWWHTLWQELSSNRDGGALARH